MKQKLTRGLDDRYRREYAKLLAKRYGTASSEVKVIVVTGTNGKATTAKYLQELLFENEQTVALLMPDVNESLGVKRIQQFLKKAKKDNLRYAIIVLPVSDIRHHSLVGIALETVIVTNASADDKDLIHQLLDEKPRFIVLNHDDERYEDLASAEATSQMISFGTADEAESKIERINLYRKGSELHLVIDHQTKLKLATYLVGTANVYNLAAAVTALYVLGENLHSVDEGAARLEPQPTNYQYLEAHAPYSVVLDYSPNEAALTSVVTTAKKLAKRRLIVVVEADLTSDEQVETLAGVVDRLVVVDVNDYKPSRGTIERVVSPDAAIKLALRAARQDDSVLLAGPIFARPEQDGSTYADITIEHTLQD
ncbi:MAG: Mur ligase family protein [Candidatus Saccharibacteria bacterium]